MAQDPPPPKLPGENNKGFFSDITIEDVVLYIVMIGVLLFMGSFLNKQSELISSPLTELNTNERLDFTKLTAVQLRYDFASRVLVTNTGRSNLSFLIGSILCILGGLIIVRRVRTESSSLSGGSENLKLSLQSNSPGLIVVVIGAIIVCFSIYFKDKYEMRDGPAGSVSSQILDGATPEELTDEQKQNLSEYLEELKNGGS